MIKVLPLVILFHVILGVLAAIKSKTFKFDKLISFMKMGTLIFVFLIMLDILYQSSLESNLGYIFITGTEGLRGASWISAMIYYVYNIYESFKKLGMPKLKNLEQELEQYNINEEGEHCD